MIYTRPSSIGTSTSSTGSCEIEILTPLANLSPSHSAFASTSTPRPTPHALAQDALDRYIFNHGDLRVLKVETQWDQTWGFDFNQYAKIFHYAREKGIRLVGLNAPQSLLHLINKVPV